MIVKSIRQTWSNIQIRSEWRTLYLKMKESIIRGWFSGTTREGCTTRNQLFIIIGGMST